MRRCLSWALALATVSCAPANATKPIGPGHAWDPSGAVAARAPVGHTVERVVVAHGSLQSGDEDTVVAATYSANGAMGPSTLFVRRANGTITDAWQLPVEASPRDDEPVGIVRVEIVPVKGGRLVQVEYQWSQQGHDPRELLLGTTLLAVEGDHLRVVLDCATSHSVTRGPTRATTTTSRKLTWTPNAQGVLVVERTTSHDCGVCESTEAMPDVEPTRIGTYEVDMHAARALGDDVCAP